MNELRDLVESKSEDPVVTDKIEKIQKTLDAQEEKNQKQTQKYMEAENEARELKDRVSELEKLLDGGANATDADVKAAEAEMKAYEKLVRYGERDMERDEVKTLRVADDTQGGYLAPADRSTEIIKQITEISRFRSLARVTPTTKNTLEIPKRTALLTAGWVGETQTDTASNSQYGMEKIQVHKMKVPVPVTHELLMDADVDVISEINTDIVEEFARLEGAAFINGTGTTTQPQGVLTNGDVTEYNSGSAADITADSLLLLPGEIKTGYNLSFIMNRKTLARIRTLKRGDGEYLWVPGVASGMPSTVAGLPYTEMPDMPDIGANATPVACGDFFRGYRIADNINIQMIRDDYSRKGEGIVEFMFYKRVGGQVTLAEAIQKLKCAV